MTYSVELPVFFDDFISEFIGVSRADTGAICVVLLADHAKRFSAIWARLTVGGADNTYAPHWLAIAVAIPLYVADLIFHLSFDGASLF